MGRRDHSDSRERGAAVESWGSCLRRDFVVLYGVRSRVCCQTRKGSSLIWGNVRRSASKVLDSTSNSLMKEFLLRKKYLSLRYNIPKCQTDFGALTPESLRYRTKKIPSCCRLLRKSPYLDKYVEYPVEPYIKM